ncbi:hypothetical protein AAG584_14935 [Vreelandella titanicae]|uniref:hypothetical protein n=1 Tax=Vreelandella titanicae TaxID=664683 RepID=UPI0011440EE6|nr:hypothetical protein [Halomonas titanicae]
MIKTDKNIVFTVTHGRTGTTMLTEVFKIFEDTRSEHEPEPNYASILPKVKENPRYAIKFLEDKIELINKFNESNYVETSNVFGKGFFIPLIRMGVFPKLVFLNREFREVAKSLFKRGSFPMRTKMGMHFSSDPSYPGTLSIFQPETLTDYQICFWGVLDSYFRQVKAGEIYDKMGKDYVWVSAGDFNDFNKTLIVGEKLGLRVSDKSKARDAHNVVANTHHNPNKKNNVEVRVDFDKEEGEVLDRVAFYEPMFVEQVLGSTFLDKHLAEKII